MREEKRSQRRSRKKKKKTEIFYFRTCSRYMVHDGGGSSRNKRAVKPRGENINISLQPARQ